MNKARRGGGETNEIFRRLISKLNTNNIVIFTFCYNNIIVDCSCVGGETNKARRRLDEQDICRLLSKLKTNFIFIFTFLHYHYCR